MIVVVNVWNWLRERPNSRVDNIVLGLWELHRLSDPSNAFFLERRRSSGIYPYPEKEHQHKYSHGCPECSLIGFG